MLIRSQHKTTVGVLLTFAAQQHREDTNASDSDARTKGPLGHDEQKQHARSIALADLKPGSHLRRKINEVHTVIRRDAGTTANSAEAEACEP